MNKSQPSNTENDLTDAQKKVFYNIKEFIEIRGFPPTIREIAKSLKLSAPTVQEQIKRLVKKGYISRVKNKARSIEILRLPESFMIKNRGKLVKVPVIGEIAAGIPVFAKENYTGEVWIDSRYISGDGIFALKVKGDSMKDAGINEGNLVIIKKQPVAENNEIIAALIDDEATIKRLSIQPDKIFLVPANKNYSNIDVTLRDDFRILGKVITWISEET